MKKILGYLAALIVVIGIGLGWIALSDTTDNQVGKEQKIPDEIELSVTWWGNLKRNERTQAVLNLYASENDQISFQKSIGEWTDYWNQLNVLAAGHQLPDIMQMDYRYLRQYLKNDLLLDLTPYIEDGTLNVSDMDESMLKAGVIGGRNYAICTGVSAPALLYNKKLLEENYITMKDDMNLEEFMDLCSEVYRKTRYKTNLAYGHSEDFMNYVLRGQGQTLFWGTGLGVNSPEDFLPFFMIYETGTKEGWIIEPSVFSQKSIGTVEQDPLVTGTGSSNMSWCGFFYSNQLAAAQESIGDKIKIGITNWPACNIKKANYLQPNQFWSVSSYSENPEEAIKVIDYFINNQECNEILLEERGIPASAKMAEIVSRRADEISIETSRYLNEVVIPNSSALSPSAPYGAQDVFDLISDLEARICDGEISAKEASAELFVRGNEMLRLKY